MNEPLDIEVTAIQSHRNGISGNHFYSVYFTFKEDGKTHDLIAVIPGGQGNCFVVSKNDPDACWRGDHFEPDLKEAVAQWVAKKFDRPVETIRKELETNNTSSEFTDEENEILYHAAALALGYEKVFDELAGYLDLADNALDEVKKKLIDYLRS